MFTLAIKHPGLAIFDVGFVPLSGCHRIAKVFRAIILQVSELLAMRKLIFGIREYLFFIYNLSHSSQKNTNGNRKYGLVKHFIIVLFSLPVTLSTFAFEHQQPGEINVKNFGATGDGKTLDTKAINDAIDAAVKQGGGTVYFPSGTFLSFSIHLKSNISLYLDQGCTLMAADTTANGKYDAGELNAFDQFQDFGHSHWQNSLIWGENLEDISILGTGIINGKGLRRNASARRPWGNKAIALKLCRNVILKDFTILNGGHFGILATGVDNFTIDNLKMDTNRDGMDIDCCNHVHISNCSINSPWDDAIVLKSSYALGYLKSTQNVTITNCAVAVTISGTFYNATYGRKEWKRVPDREGPTGRIKFGTESNGGFKNITISNCVFDFCRGLALETVDGAMLENISISNITMRDIVNAPFFLRLSSRLRGPLGTETGALRRVIISNVMVYNADSHFSSIISGVPGHDIEDVQFNNIRIYYRQMDSSFEKSQLWFLKMKNNIPNLKRWASCRLMVFLSVM